MVDSPGPIVDLDDVRGVPISEVCALLGVPMPTLRSWELRYSMPSIRHLHGRHRRYLPAEVHAIRMMRDEIARGHQAANAAATVRRVLGIGGDAGVLIHRLLGKCERLDGAGMRTVLDDSDAGLGLPGCIDDVLLPAMRQVGNWWEVGHCDMAQERLFTQSVRGWLDRRIAFAPAPTHPRPILFACGPNDGHTIGLESLALLLRHRGWPCHLLGARPSIANVVAAAKASDAAGFALVSQLATGRRTAVDAIKAVRGIRVPVFYAGNSFFSARSRQGVPGDYLGTRIGYAAAHIDTALTATGLPAAG